MLYHTVRYTTTGYGVRRKRLCALAYNLAEIHSKLDPIYVQNKLFRPNWDYSANSLHVSEFNCIMLSKKYQTQFSHFIP